MFPPKGYCTCDWIHGLKWNWNSTRFDVVSLWYAWLALATLALDWAHAHRLEVWISLIGWPPFLLGSYRHPNWFSSQSSKYFAGLSPQIQVEAQQRSESYSRTSWTSSPSAPQTHDMRLDATRLRHGRRFQDPLPQILHLDGTAHAAPWGTWLPHPHEPHDSIHHVSFCRSCISHGVFLKWRVPPNREIIQDII